MRRRLPRLCFVLGAALGCTGHLAGDFTVDLDAAPVDAPSAPLDAGSPARDVPATPIDRGTARDAPPVPIDLGPLRDVPATPIDRVVVRDVPPPPVDTGPPPPVDAGTPAACAGGPLAAPLAGCRPATPPSTGDPRQDCVNRINQFRRECQCLPPLQRWTDGEACADREAQLDQQTMTAHNGFTMRLCASGSGQNECPGWLGWGSVTATISGCLQQMWDEGPGDFYGPPAHGHYLNMSSAGFSRVACGFFTSGSATTALQNFQ